jgi:hypothetical protein
MHSKQPTPQIPDGVRYARYAGHALGLILICMAILSAIRGLQGIFGNLKAAYFIVYAVVLNIPFTRISEYRWKPIYALLVVCSAAFVFIMVVSVMFSYIEAADRGERLGVPGLEGTLIFIALLQVPAVLFQRKPDLLD